MMKLSLSLPPMLLLLLLLPLSTCLTTSTTATSSAISTPPTTSVDHLHSFLPAEWKTFCDVSEGVDDDVNATVICRVSSQVPVLWKLADLRESLNATLGEQTKFKVAVQVQCEAGANISLPFPFRAPGLVKLIVRHCGLLDKFADVDGPAARLGDWLQVQDIRHCQWLNDPQQLQQLLLKLSSITSHYDCGQDSTLVTIVDRNNSDVNLPPSETATAAADPCDLAAHAFQAVNLTYPMDLAQLLDSVPVFERFWNQSVRLGGVALECARSLEPLRSVHFVWSPNAPATPQPSPGSTSSSSGGSSSSSGSSTTISSSSSSTENPSKDLLETFITIRHLHTSCRFERLQVLDQSHSPVLSRQHFEYLVQNTRFPQLRVLNFSHTGLTEVPKPLLQWRRYFAGSKLQVMDLSHCRIAEVGHIPPDINLHGVATRLDLRHNRITRITPKMVTAWALVPDLEVDVRHNPVDCACELTDLLSLLLRNSNDNDDDDSWARGPGGSYYRDLVSRLTCHTPSRLSGRTLGSLSASELDCPVREAGTAALRVGMAVLGVVVVVLAVLLALAVRYRREVRILMYTRVNILLPCGLPPSASLPDKTYDAFVAYAHQDSEWVLNNLMKRLEDAEGPPKGRRPCRLCLHQRDFVVGKAIIDNIVDCIAASRHTIVVLTNSFVRSGWAMEELQQAYHQSLEERSRHLVVVMLEKVEERHMSPALRRCCKTFTYLQVSDAFFWDRLLYSIQVGGRKSSDRAPTPPADDSGSYTITNTNTSNTSNKSNNGTDVGLQPKKETENGWSTEGWGVMEPDFDKQMPFPETLRTLSVDSGFSLASTDTQQVTLSLSDV